MARPAERPARGRRPTSRSQPKDTPSETPRSRPPRLIELSHEIHHGLVTYPGLPGPEISDYLPREASTARYGPGTEFHIGRISMVANTGTNLDSPSTAFAGATDVAGLPLRRVADLDGVVVRIGAGGARSTATGWPPTRLKAERCWSTRAGTATGPPSATAPAAAFASMPPRPRSSASAPSRSAPTPSWPMGSPASAAQRR
jgi:hypothetical protein